MANQAANAKPAAPVFVPPAKGSFYPTVKGGFQDTDIITFIIGTNPKSPRSASYARYALYPSAGNSLSFADLAKLYMSKGYGVGILTADLKWESARGFLRVTRGDVVICGR